MNKFIYLFIILSCFLFCDNINSQNREINKYIKKIKDNPSDQSNYLKLAELYQQDGNVEQVDNVYSQMLVYWVDNAEINYRWGLTLSLMGEHLKSLPHYYASLKLDSLETNVMYNYSISLVETKKYKVALRVMERACKLEPQNNKYLTFKNKILVLTTATVEDLKAFNNKPFSQIYNQAIQAYNRKDLNGASSLIDNALQIDPSNTKAMFVKAQITLDQKEYMDAISILQQLLDIEPQNYDAILYLGEAYYITRNYENSFNSYYRSLSNLNTRPEGIKNCKAILRIMKLQNNPNYTECNNLFEDYLLENNISI